MQQEDDGSNHYARGHEEFDPRTEYDQGTSYFRSSPLSATLNLLVGDADPSTRRDLVEAAFRRAALGYKDGFGNEVLPNDYAAEQLVDELRVTMYRAFPQSKAPEGLSRGARIAHEQAQHEAASLAALTELSSIAEKLPTTRQWRGAKVPHLLYTKLALARAYFWGWWRLQDDTPRSRAAFKAFERLYLAHVTESPGTAEKLYQVLADVVKAACEFKDPEVVRDLDRWILFAEAAALRVPFAQARARIIGREEAGKEAHKEALARSEMKGRVR